MRVDSVGIFLGAIVAFASLGRVSGECMGMTQLVWSPCGIEGREDRCDQARLSWQITRLASVSGVLYLSNSLFSQGCPGCSMFCAACGKHEAIFFRCNRNRTASSSTSITYS